MREKVRLGYRAPYILDLARDITSGTTNMKEIENWQEDEAALYKRLLKIKGIGPYAAGSMLKLLGYYSYPAPDSWSRKRFMLKYGYADPPTDNQIQTHYQRYGKWTGLVFWLDMTNDWHDQSPPSGP